MNDKLKNLRNEIDTIDEQIVSLVAKRFEISKQIGEVKKELRIPPLDTKRLEELINSKKNSAKMLGVSENVIEKLYKIIHEHSVDIQKKI